MPAVILVSTDNVANVWSIGCVNKNKWLIYKFSDCEQIFVACYHGTGMAMEKKAKNPVKSIETSLKIIQELRATDKSGVSTLASSLGMTKGTVHNHLATLEQDGYVVKQDDKYKLGMRFFEIGQQVVQQKQIHQLARPELKKITRETGEIANLMIEEQGRGIYIDIIHGKNAVNIDTSVGDTHYLHTCALGKAILSRLPSDRVDRILDRNELPKETSNTVTDRKELNEELETISREGVAYDGEERAEGIRCVATPVQTNSGRVLGAISVTGPARRMKSERVRNEIAEQLKDAANVIEINASYS